MATAEGFTFAGTDWNDGTTFYLEPGGFDPGIAPKRFRWVQGADSDGALPADEAHYDNAEMTVRVRVAAQADMDTALSKIGDLVKALQECEKQPLGSAAVWTPATSTKSLTAYVLAGEVTGLPIELEGDAAGWFVKSPVITMKLTRRPFLYGAEVSSAATVTNSNPYQILTVASVTGDVAAEGRLVVTDAATQSRRHVEWGLQQRYYDAGTDLYVDSDNMVTTGFAGTQTTRTGAHDPGASGNTVIRGTLTTSPVAICGVGNLGHIGTFRVKARVYAAATADATASDFKVRLSWKEGDGQLRANAYVSPVVTAGWAEVDLGIISIPEKTLGTQRWTGQIEAYSEDPGDTLDVDYLLLFPVAEGYGKGRAPLAVVTPTSFTARDEFDQTAGNLNGKTAPVGGNWATAAMAGASTDFAVEATGHTAQRSVVSEAPANSGRYAIAGTTTFTDAIVQHDFKVSALDSSLELGPVARHTNATTYGIRAGIFPGTFATIVQPSISSGAAAPLASLPPLTVGAWYTVQMVVLASGAYGIWLFPRGETPVSVLSGTSTDLATGGSLASGKAGFYDSDQGSTANTRNYDNFLAWVPSLDAVVFSGRTAEIRHDSAQRADSTGTYYGPIQTYRGSRFYLPPGGSAGRTSRVLVKTRRNDIDLLTDDQIADSTTATIHYVPRYYVAPR